MRKSLAAIPLCLVIGFAVSTSSSSSVLAMPAPLPDDIELSAGLAQWGAETEGDVSLTEDEIRDTLLELARPLPTTPKTKAAMCETLATAARLHDLPVGFFVRLINQESGFNPEVVSPAGAQGVAQFMPKVAEEWGLKNPFDPHAALVASARFLRSLYDQLGNWGLAAAAYNGGIGRVQKWIAKRGKLPDETRHYVMTITGKPAENWADGKPQHAKFSVPPRAPCQEIAYLADEPDDADVPLPRARVVEVITPAAGPHAKETKTKITIVRGKGGTKVAVINVRKGSSKVASVKAKIAAPKTIVAEAAASPKGKHVNAKTATKVAAKSAPKAEAKGSKKAASKGRVQLADARNARK
jgi:hypothetical protein